MEPRAEPLADQLVPEMLATDLAEYLVRKGVPFRETHHISGAAVKLSEEQGVTLSDLTLAQLQNINPLFEEDVLVVLKDYGASVERKDSIGGTSKRQVLATVETLRAYIASVRDSPPPYVVEAEAEAEADGAGEPAAKRAKK